MCPGQCQWWPGHHNKLLLISIIQKVATLTSVCQHWAPHLRVSAVPIIINYVFYLSKNSFFNLCIEKFYYRSQVPKTSVNHDCDEQR